MSIVTENTTSSVRHRVLVVIAIQVVTLLIFSLVEFLARNNRPSICVGVQLLWPMLMTLDEVCGWSKGKGSFPVGLTVAINGIYGLMFSLGIIVGSMALIAEVSWVAAVRLILLLVITSTYFVIAAFLLRLTGKECERDADSSNSTESAP